ncbi:MAG: indolepyruvate ferredoxin oxidoreductase subunit alpha [Sedimentisphaerales bacterium]|nr:indolepyruvate ferredoxin oxidoreductase subunit alpha [Sedimentisphaerales bacterium]
MAELMSGNQAIARGAYEAGITVASGYPGTPSTEILENTVQYKDSIYCEWAPNEKVAFEVGAGAAFAGARTMVTMKHVGLNVAADPLMTLSYTGVEGGFVFIVADDPGMHSSQNEQDSRHYAIFGKVPMLEPSDSQEAKDFIVAAIEISEEFKTPVMFRTNTRVSHSRSLVNTAERVVSEKPVAFEKNPARWVPVPLWARGMRVRVEERMDLLKEYACRSPLNRIEWNSKELGIVTSSISYQYVKEVWPDASVLKLGMAYPYPDRLIREFADGVKTLLVVEELDPLLEEHISSLGIKCVGREFIPGIGELTSDVLRKCRAKMDGTAEPEQRQAAYAAELPNRPPVLCPGCPHRGIFHVLRKHNVVVTGDIGCYSLGAFKPLERLDSILCMGAGISMAHGMAKAGNDRKVVGMVGDSTFFHSGITGLLNVAYNKSNATIVVVDNRTTAMTGHQDHPGTGTTLMGDGTVSASIEEIAKACGIKRVTVVNPYNVEATNKVVTEDLQADEPSLIISRATCPLKERPKIDSPYQIDQDKCKNCKLCTKIGCPAIDGGGEKPTINPVLCFACGVCHQVCPADCISKVKK